MIIFLILPLDEKDIDEEKSSGILVLWISCLEIQLSTQRLGIR